ncbi:MAG: phosphoribosylanthranilate isomerase [Clostridia bacterium]|nr:phosphoribosylanthranilate isomerase [Clostridia bacterium]
MHTKIKICGIKSLEEIEFINHMDIDYIGFVFAESRRQIDAAQAKVLSAALRKDIKRVGVFVQKSIEEINTIIDKAGLDIVQVHKNYTREMIAQIEAPVWYGISIKDADSIDEANQAIAYKNVSGIVTDSYVKGMEGGTGQTFNWELLKNIRNDAFLILAGGLNPDNIGEAIKAVNPHVVDISSGAEHTIGTITMKSEEKIRKLVSEVKK